MSPPTSSNSNFSREFPGNPTISRDCVSREHTLHAENSTDHRPEPGKNARVRGQHRGRGKRGAGPRGDLRRVHPASRRPSESRGTQMRELRKREPARDESAPAEDSASEVTQVRGNSELPRIPREKDLLEEIGSYCEACEEFGHSIDVCHVYPHAEARYERLLSLKLCIRCGQSHPDECQEQTRACRACGNNRHMYALCHRRYGKEVIAARQLRDKAAASKSRKKRSRRQAFTSGAALSQTNSNGLQAQKPGAGVPRKRRRRPSFPKKSRSSR
uniref:Uncharacterized protein n=2 Tax=Caenorhabditis japonica TaxID=281687 RepID=A0A8R1DUX0_CAEJA